MIAIPPLRHFLFLLVIGIPIIFFSSCAIRDPYPDFSRDTHPIVFELWGEEKEKTGGLGLINADGSDANIVSTSTVNRMPAWSPDGKQLLFLSPWGYHNYGGLMVAHKGILCNSDGVFYERMRWASNNEILREEIEVTSENKDIRKIALWDIDSCSVSGVLYSEVTTDIFSEFDLSAQGEITFSRESKQWKRVAIYNSDHGRLTIIGDGFGPIWSPTGDRIVFTGAEGLYISDEDGNSIEKVVDLIGYYPLENGVIEWDKWPPMAVWSPDGDFLLYHRKNFETYDIIKFEIATGVETILYQGGIYPDWR
jgi:hypothetical protein